MTRKDLERTTERQRKLYESECIGIYTCNSETLVDQLGSEYLGKNSGQYGLNWKAYLWNINPDTCMIILVDFYRNADPDGFIYKDANDIITAKTVDSCLKLGKLCDTYRTAYNEATKWKEISRSIQEDYENTLNNSMNFKEINKMAQRLKKVKAIKQQKLEELKRAQNSPAYQFEAF